MYNKILFFLFCFSFMFSDESNGNRFIMNTKNNYYFDIDVINEFQQSGYSFMGTFSGRLHTKFSDSPDLKNGEQKIIQTWSDIIATNRRNDEVKPDHDAQKLEGCVFSLVVDSAGVLVSAEGNNDLAREMLEEMNSFSTLFGADNHLYPFGSDSLRKVGDVWTVETTDPLAAFTGMDNFDGNRKNVVTYSYKKNKKKKGDLIAIINCTQNIKLNGITQNWDDTFEISQEGFFKGTMKYNLTKQFFSGSKMSGSLTGVALNIQDQKERRFTMYLDLKLRTKLK